MEAPSMVVPTRRRLKQPNTTLRSIGPPAMGWSPPEQAESRVLGKARLRDKNPLTCDPALSERRHRGTELVKPALGRLDAT